MGIPSQLAALGDALKAAASVEEVDAATLRQHLGFEFHRGVLAVGPRPQARTIDPTAGLRLLCDHIADPANVGALVRNAYALGARDVALWGCADPWSRRAIRGSMGYAFHLPVHVVDDAPAWCTAELARHPALALAVATSDPRAPSDRAFRHAGPTLLTLGNEGHGVRAPLLERATHRVRIPMHRGADSLNVAAASAVLIRALAPCSETLDFGSDHGETLLDCARDE